MSDVYDPYEVERRIAHTLKSARAALEYYAGKPVYQGEESSDENAGLAMLFADIDRDIKSLDTIMSSKDVDLTP